MVYFLVNNTFHLVDVKLLAKQLKSSGYKVGLIQIPYSLKLVVDDRAFDDVKVCEPLPFVTNILKNKRTFLKGLYEIYLAKRFLNRFPAKETDVLFVFTEAEIMNQLFIQRFYQVHSKVFLMKDGMAAEVYYNMTSDKLSKRASLWAICMRYIFRLKGYIPFHTKGYTYPMLSDIYFNGFCSFQNICIKRNIQTYVLNRNVESGKRNNNVIFLSQPLNHVYSEQQYLYFIENILQNLCMRFDKVYVKCHPAEINGLIEKKIIGLIDEMPKHIIYIGTDDIVEEIVSYYEISYAVSFFSTALQNLFYVGIEPIYLFHLMPELMEREEIRVLYDNLIEKKYNYISSLDEVVPGYKSNLSFNDVNKISVVDLL